MIYLPHIETSRNSETTITHYPLVAEFSPLIHIIMGPISSSPLRHLGNHNNSLSSCLRISSHIILHRSPFHSRYSEPHRVLKLHQNSQIYLKSYCQLFKTVLDQDFQPPSNGLATIKAFNFLKCYLTQKRKLTGSYTYCTKRLKHQLYTLV